MGNGPGLEEEERGIALQQWRDDGTSCAPKRQMGNPRDINLDGDGARLDARNAQFH
jgi:hypothetical protein